MTEYPAEEAKELSMSLNVGDIFTIKGRNNPLRPLELQDFRVISSDGKTVEYVPEWSESEKRAMKRKEVNYWKRRRRAMR